MSANTRIAAWVVAAGVLLAAAAWWWWGRAPAPAAPLDTTQTTGGVAAPPVAPALPASLATAPVEPAASEPRPSEAPLDAQALGPAFAQLLGADAVKRWLQLDDFARRFAATVDNLGRDHAPALLWPVPPTPGRFATTEHDGRTVVDPDNQQRYVPFVRLVEGLDTRATVALYVRLLPLLQQAYEALGYPGRRFHTRLLAVIDHLLAAPPAPEWIEVRLTEVRGPIPSERPWVRYEFADAALQSASAGHKLMVRIGGPNERRLQAKLRELRAELVRRAAP